MCIDGIDKTVLLLGFFQSVLAVGKGRIPIYILPIDGLDFFVINFFRRNFFGLKKLARRRQQQEWDKKKEVLHFRKMFYWERYKFTET
tara:strand:- start:298 stop:561 length:264 start_codon:yes stop_codon:yes gene_type:complete